MRKQNYIKGRQPGHVPSNDFNFVLSLSVSLLFFSIFDSEQLFFLLVWSFFLSYLTIPDEMLFAGSFVRLFV